MNAYLDSARQAARAAGEIIRLRFGTRVGVHHKGPIDLVTEVDLACERLILDILQKDWPDHDILGEEGGRTGHGQGPLWIVDPLDGTRSFAHGYPFVSVSIGLEIEGKVRLGVVYDPIRDELFEAIQGHGAHLNGQPIGVSSTRHLKDALLVTGFPYHLAEIDNQALFDLFREMVVHSGGIRRDGSAALDFCYLACGRLDGYWEFFLKPWDAAAGALIAHEAGATVTNLGGQPYELRQAEVLVSNGHIHQEMIERARPFLQPMRRWL
ncbi:inositol monophosphatase [bacterium]|nr:inositol monophosphatase [bacterium]